MPIILSGWRGNSQYPSFPNQSGTGPSQPAWSKGNDSGTTTTSPSPNWNPGPRYPSTQSSPFPSQVSTISLNYIIFKI